MIPVRSERYARVALIALVLCTAVIAAGCRDYSFLSAPGGADAPPATASDFADQLSSEYRLLGDFAAQTGDEGGLSPLFYDKSSRAARATTVTPESVEQYKIPSFAVTDLMSARRQLVAALNSANVPENAKMLAMAQVKFDCWLVYQRYQKKPDGYIGCRESFYQAMANVDLTRTANVVKTAVKPRQTIRFEDETVVLNSQSHDMIETIAEKALAAEGTLITLTGHAKTNVTIEDTSNNSVRRIIAVRNALYQNGIDPDSLTVIFERGGSSLDVDIEIHNPAGA